MQGPAAPSICSWIRPHLMPTGSCVRPHGVLHGMPYILSTWSAAGSVPGDKHCDPGLGKSVWPGRAHQHRWLCIATQWSALCAVDTRPNRQQSQCGALRSTSLLYRCKGRCVISGIVLGKPLRSRTRCRRKSGDEHRCHDHAAN